MILSSLQLPNQKEWAGGVGGLLAFGIIAGLKYFSHVDLGEAANGAIITLLPLILVKLVPASDQDILAHLNDDIAQAGTIVGKLTAASDSGTTPTPKAEALAAKVQ